MSRFPTLRNALVVALAVSSMGGLCCPEPEDQNRVEQLKKNELTAELEACLADDLACDVLCYEVLRARGYDLENGFRPQFSRCTVDIDEEGVERPVVHMTYTIPEECIGGRRPAGATSAPCGAADPVGAHLAGIAHLEAISVHAFIELARDLREHGAPDELVGRALAAAADEVEHASAVAELARRHGAALTVPTVTPRTRRSLVEIATTNAVEGCVRELYGAIVALWQGQHAGDALTRDVFAVIAADELRHAELSFDIDRWARRLLDDGDRASIDAARQAASASLERDIGRASDVLVAALGLPDHATATRLAAVARATATTMRRA